MPFLSRLQIRSAIGLPEFRRSRDKSGHGGYNDKTLVPGRNPNTATTRQKFVRWRTSSTPRCAGDNETPRQRLTRDGLRRFRISDEHANSGFTRVILTICPFTKYRTETVAGLYNYITGEHRYAIMAVPKQVLWMRMYAHN
jgi:hypothetical protein